MLTCTGMPKGFGTLVVKAEDGVIVAQKVGVADVYKTSSRVKRLLETGSFYDEAVQARYNENPDAFTFEARNADETAELAVEADEAPTLADEIAASEVKMDKLEAAGATYTNNYGGNITPEAYKAASKTLKEAGQIDQWHRLAARYYGHKTVEIYLASVARKNKK